MPAAPVRMTMPPRDHLAPGGVPRRATAAPQATSFRIPWVGEFAARVLDKPAKLGTAVVHAGAQIEEAILGVISGQVLQDMWIFSVNTSSGPQWVTHEDGSDLTKAGVRWVVVSR